MATRIGVLADGALAALDAPAVDRPVAGPARPRAAGAALRGDRGAAGRRRGEADRVLAVARRRARRRCWGSTSSSSRVSTLAAVLIGVPIGILAARRPRLGAPIVWLANVAQTIPSLAMFGFLLPLPFVGGLGARVAITVLVLYALLPIIRTTVAGHALGGRVADRSRAWRSA